MDKKDLEQLLGGYATNTLTEEERKALFEAALRDQTLFDALANEQALKELLDGPRNRQRVLEALERADATAEWGWVARVATWFRRPANLALAGSFATAVLVVVFVARLFEQTSPPASEQTVTADSRSAAGSRPERDEVTRSEPLSQAERAVEADRLTKKSSPPAPTPKPAKSEAKLEQALPQPAPSSTPGAPPATAQAPSARQEFARAPQAARPEAKLRAMPEDEPRVAQAPSAGVPTPGEPPQQTARQQASVAQTSESGKARELFYAQAREPESREGRAAEQQERGMLRSEEKKSRDVLKDVQKEEAEGSVRAFGEPVGAFAPMKALARPLGLRYSILKRRADGRYAEADPVTAFSASDALRLTIEVNETGYLYILKQDRAGKWTILFPTAAPVTKTDVPEAKVLARTRYMIPATGALTLERTPDPTPLLIVFAREPQPEFRNIVPGRKPDADVAGKSPAQLGALANRARTDADSRSLLVEKVEPTQPGTPNEQAVYVVNPSSDSASRLVVEIPLTVR
ncbi:MAG: DUF4384 domain-containing protein [Nitrospiraceae bacterium]